MVVLLTGCSGYVGSAIAEALVDDGAKVLAMWNRTRPPLEGVQLRRLDLGAPELPEELRRLPRFDACVNAAGVPKFFGVQESRMRSVHVSGALALAQECAWREVPLLHVSTAFVCARDGEAVPESAPSSGAVPANPYERTKTEAEWMLDRLGGAAIDVLRPAIVTPERGAPAELVRRSPVGSFLHSALRDLRRWRESAAPESKLVCTDRRWLASLVVDLVRRPAGCGIRWWNLGAKEAPTVLGIAEALGVAGSSAAGDAKDLRATYWKRYLDPARTWETTGTTLRLERRGLCNPTVTADGIADGILSILNAREVRIA